MGNRHAENNDILQRLWSGPKPSTMEAGLPFQRRGSEMPSREEDTMKSLCEALKWAQRRLRRRIKCSSGFAGAQGSDRLGSQAG